MCLNQNSRLTTLKTRARLKINIKSRRDLSARVGKNTGRVQILEIHNNS